MPTLGIALVTAVLTAAILLTRLRIGFAIVVTSAVLVPAPLSVNNPLTHYATFTRVLVVVLAIRLFFGIRAGEVPRAALRWTPVHSAFAVFLTCAYVAGIALATSAVLPKAPYSPAFDLLDQFVFFVVMLACVRAVGDLRWVLGMVSVVLLASAGVGVIEHVTGNSWGHWLLKNARIPTVAADPLERRVGHVRVRGGAEYALQYGWVTAMLLPALLGWLAAWKGRLVHWLPVVLASVGLVLLAEYWAYSRSALAVIGGLVIIAAVAMRERRIVLLTLAGVAVSVVAFVTIGALQDGFVGLPSGYVDVRTGRIPVILQLVASHPLHGLGLGAISSLGLQSTDTTYLQLYGDMGLLGLVSGVALLVTAFTCCIGGLRSQVRVERAAAGAAVAGGVALLVGGLAYDAFRSLSSARPFWVLVAIGLAATEYARGPLPRLVPRDRRLLIGGLVVAEVLGWVAVALAPVHYAQQYRFTTVSVVREARPGDPVTGGTTLLNTVCGMVDDLPADAPPARYDCRDPQLAAGMGQLRIQSTTPTRVSSAVELIESQAALAELSAF
ncbi:MAG: hypothetical protein QOJ03_2038, partial [Frankiaceae bacterium]|nr:hypothetical protein [Frankiaceae bacterium]